MHSHAQKRGVQINLIHSDIFDLGKLFTHTFDIVLEYTCFCAIDPSRRLDYVRLTHQILKPDGKIVGLFFPIDKDVYGDGPPYAIDLDLTISLFSKYFTLNAKKYHDLSVARRIGREIFIIFRKIEVELNPIV